MQIVVATHNPGKLRELRRIFAELVEPGVALVGARELGLPEVPEEGETFEENATEKARATARASGRMALADDSGLEVDALGGAPGVRSARFAALGPWDPRWGERPADPARASVQKLLSLLEGVPEERRTARFRCVLALVDPAGGRLALASGTCEGRIAASPRGAGGFGYDPVFVPIGGKLTMAEIPDEAKDALSHRGRACEAMRATLRRVLARDNGKGSE